MLPHGTDADYVACRSRTNQYLRYMMSNLEELRYIREYRPPIM
jgi:hypothetical protein